MATQLAFAFTIPQGAQGETGPAGPAGTDGAAGATGATGATGPAGESAYQIWQDNGHTGTETDFLNWLAAQGAAQITATATATQGAAGSTPAVNVSVTNT